MPVSRRWFECLRVVGGVLSLLNSARMNTSATAHQALGALSGVRLATRSKRLKSGRGDVTLPGGLGRYVSRGGDSLVCFSTAAEHLFTPQLSFSFKKIKQTNRPKGTQTSFVSRPLSQARTRS
eukprot:671731-Prymnesium_polylepis.2